MPSAEKLSIFVASPADVTEERRHVSEVVTELNRTVAPDKGVFLQVVRWEDDAFPGYGRDAQELVNAQIAEMTKYAIFVGIMWNRLGTPTARAESGTVEEFERAADALSRTGRPEIWFYFREPSPDAEGRDKLLAFRKRIEANGLPWGYESPSDFRDKFRNQMLLWLSARGRKRRHPKRMLLAIPAALAVILAAVLFAHFSSDNRKLVLLMDSYAPATVFDDSTREATETNAHVIERILKPYDKEIRVEKELVTTSYDHDYSRIVAKNPDLVIVHYSSFYGHTVEDGENPRIISFLTEMARTRTKFLIYTRSIPADAADKERIKNDIVNKVPEMRGRMELFTFEPDLPAKFLNPDVAAAIRRETRAMLGLQ